MSPAQLCKIERGCNEPTASTLRRIADALGVTVSVILGEGAPAAVAPFSTGVSGGNAGVGRVEDDYIQVLRAFARGEPVPDEIVEFERKIAAEEARLGMSGQMAMQLVYPYGADERSAGLLARDVRTSLGMGSQPRTDLAPVLESVGLHIVTVQRPSKALAFTIRRDARCRSR